MPLDCSLTCGDYTPLSWAEEDPVVQQFLIYCALNAAGGGGGGPFQPIGVYTVTEDGPYAVPADASLIIWDVPTQTGDQEMDFTLVPEGSEVTIFIQNSNGFSVTGPAGSVFTLNDASPRYVNIRSIDGAGSVMPSDGSAARYDVGESGQAIPLLNGNNTHDGFNTFTMDLSLGERLFFTELGTLYPDLIRLYSTVYTIGMEPGAMRFTTDNAGAFRFYLTNGTQLLGINASGTLIATGNTGGTRIAKLATGIATMAAGTVTIPDAFASNTTPILFSPGFTPLGNLSYSVNPGVSFTITSDDGTDAGPVSWQRSVI